MNDDLDFVDRLVYVICIGAIMASCVLGGMVWV